MDFEEGNALGKTAVFPALKTNWLGHSYYYEETIGSTNVRLREMALGGAAHGTVLLANYQAQGKGRLGRQWEAPPGTALLLSVLLRLSWPPERLAWATMLASVAMADAIESVTGATVRLKWPNDVLVQVEGGWRKVCGLLAEVVAEEATGKTAVIVGSGVNVNLTQADLPPAHTPPTSLLLATGKPISRLSLLTAYLERLEQGVETAVAGRSPLGRWAQRLITIGEAVQVTYLKKDDSFHGVAEAVNECGHLLVREPNGVLHAVASGDVTLRNR